MHQTIGRPTTGNAFEKYERLHRSARQAADRARRMRSEAAAARLRAAQMRRDMKRMLTRCRSDHADVQRSPATGAPRNSAAPAAQLTLLTTFLHARLDEDGRTADLFHEAGCPGAEASGCHCLVPQRVRHDVLVRHGLARDCEEAIDDPDHDACDWPHSEMRALLRLKVLALPYELHRQWREEWRP
ncbi:DUF6221 family protein [Streptomyces monomycini]|uniref:DUF6221 family protein n=1 Tax=Streptomyces monomycini TaxID=371720 RepID=UPI001EECA7F5|nr:DUF6221 family protein [Streptomyces monomycini]